MELWINIKGYENNYQISNFGNVRSLPHSILVKQDRYNNPRLMHWKGKILKQGIDGKGYRMVVLCQSGRREQKTVHRLVAMHFIDNHHNKPAVNHIDFNPLNNHVDNLEWCTIRENNIHSKYRHRYPLTQHRSFFNEQDRKTLNKLFDMGIGVSAISQQLNMPYNAVRYVYRLRNKPDLMPSKI